MKFLNFLKSLFAPKAKPAIKTVDDFTSDELLDAICQSKYPDDQDPELVEWMQAKIADDMKIARREKHAKAKASKKSAKKPQLQPA